MPVAIYHVGSTHDIFLSAMTYLLNMRTTDWRTVFTTLIRVQQESALY
jgi:hypothetical protein